MEHGSSGSWLSGKVRAYCRAHTMSSPAKILVYDNQNVMFASAWPVPWGWWCCDWMSGLREIPASIYPVADAALKG